MTETEEDEPPDPHPRRRDNPDAACPSHPHPVCDGLVRQAWDAHWFCEERKGGTVIICYPNGFGVGFVTVRMDAGDDHVESLRRQFRRRGLRL